MSKMIKALGILLAVIFIISVAATAIDAKHSTNTGIKQTTVAGQNATATKTTVVGQSAVGTKTIVAGQNATATKTTLVKK
jgi:hypothetical protein